MGIFFFCMLFVKLLFQQRLIIHTATYWAQNQKHYAGNMFFVYTKIPSKSLVLYAFKKLLNKLQDYYYNII